MAPHPRQTSNGSYHPDGDEMEDLAKKICYLRALRGCLSFRGPRSQHGQPRAAQPRSDWYAILELPSAGRWSATSGANRRHCLRSSLQRPTSRTIDRASSLRQARCCVSMGPELICPTRGELRSNGALLTLSPKQRLLPLILGCVH